MTTFTGRETITVVHRTNGPPDPLGVPTRVESLRPVSGCSVQPLSTDEELSNVDRVTTRWRLIAPANTALSVTDAVVSQGLLYEIDGDPQLWTDIRGQPHHLECLLRRATG